MTPSFYRPYWTNVRFGPEAVVRSIASDYCPNTPATLPGMSCYCVLTAIVEFNRKRCYSLAKLRSARYWYSKLTLVVVISSPRAIIC